MEKKKKYVNSYFYYHAHTVSQRERRVRSAGDGGGGRPRGSYTQRRTFLPVPFAAVLAEYRAQHFGHAVHAQLTPDRQSPEQLDRASLAQQRVERQRHAGEVLGRAHLVELTAKPQRQFFSRVHGHAPIHQYIIRTYINDVLKGRII